MMYFFLFLYLLYKYVYVYLEKNNNKIDLNFWCSYVYMYQIGFYSNINNYMYKLIRYFKQVNF